MNQVVKFKNSGYCKFLEEIGEDFDYLNEEKSEKKPASQHKTYSVLVLLSVLTYLFKDLLLACCVLIFISELFRELLKFLSLAYIEFSLSKIKSFYSFLHSEKASDLFWNWIKTNCKHLEDCLQVKLFQSNSSNPKHIERVLNSIELNSFIQLHKGGWSLLAVLKTVYTLHQIISQAKTQTLKIKAEKFERKVKITPKISQFYHLQKQIVEILIGVRDNIYNQEDLTEKILGVKGLLEIILNSQKVKNLNKVPKKESDKKAEVKPVPVEVNTERVEEEKDVIYVIEGQGEQEVKNRIVHDWYVSETSKSKDLNRLDLKKFIESNKK